jgi:hypothetical protein
VGLDSIVKRHKLSAIGGIVILVVLLSIISGPAIKRQLNRWKLLPEPERLTELYFTKPNSLPTTYSPTTDQAVAFTVHNLEYRDEQYSYKVVEATEPGASGTVLSSGTFKLKQNQYKRLLSLEPIQPLANRVNVAVELTNVNESIDYWVTKAAV